MKFLYSIILFSLISMISLAQERDSIVSTIPDTLQTSRVDSIINQQAKSDLDTVVYSSASDSIIFFVKDKKMSIHGDGKIEYQRMRISYFKDKYIRTLCVMHYLKTELFLNLLLERRAKINSSFY